MSAQLAGDQRPHLTLQRRFHATPAQIFGAWTDPKQLIRWFGPDEGKVESAKTDLRVGGRYHIVFFTEDGEMHDVSGVYQEVVTNEKLKFTWRWITLPERESLVTVTLKADGDHTIMTLLHEQFFDENARDGHREGWTGAFDKLEKLFASA
ncbi:SRPBCC domain-containing protein [Terrarubrum flagellatum]|uniref:SRPBCC family protein n=1 Tax=Terrirubrum flagellatum TaxID=2895980 RepID=UPI0031455A1E